MLLDHTSGVPGTEYANNMGYAYNDDIYEETLGTLARSHLKAAPGGTAPYCNDGFTLAEMIVEEVSGQDYIDFVSERLCAPLSLSRTGASVGERPDEGYTRYYQSDTGKKVPAEVLSVLGAGGLSSTPTELVLFADSFCKGGRGILSDGSIAEMTKPQRSEFATACIEKDGINPEMAYGLGFDLVEFPPLQEKDIKVIGKGGDSDDYHTMLLAAPGERVAVAATVAGQGSSVETFTFDILTSVLEAKGLVEKEEEPVQPPPAPQEIPREYAEFAGYYSGGNLQRISFDLEAGTATLDTISSDDTMSVPLAYRDGGFFTETGKELVLLSLEGRKCLVAKAFGSPLMMVASEMVPAVTDPLSLAIEPDGKLWLRRNVKPFESIGLAGTHVIEPATYPDLPGYVDFVGLKVVTSPETAGMISDVVRDESELDLVDMDGETWAWVSNMLFSPGNDVEALSEGGKSVTIGEDGYNEWFSAKADLVLKVRKPEGARVIVFSPDHESVYDSEIDKGDIYVLAGSLVEIAGMPGDVVEMSVSPPPGDKS
jgi:hypothetical protein